MKVRKAVVTAAGPDHQLPLQRLVDRQGMEKTALQLILDEVGQAGIEDTALIVRPGDSAAFRAAAGDHVGRLTFIEQASPRGYGDAIHRARDFVGREPFLHLVGDHLYLSGDAQRGCARQLVELAESENCSVSAVQATRENMLPYFGTVGGSRVARQNKLYEVNQVIEKPTPTEAEQKLHIAGLRAGYYLCFFGMHVLSPQVMTLLSEAMDSSAKNIPLATALAGLAQRERYLAFEISGTRYNIGVKYGLLIAQLALALSGDDRDFVLTEMIQLLAEGK